MDKCDICKYYDRCKYEKDFRKINSILNIVKEVSESKPIIELNCSKFKNRFEK